MTVILATMTMLIIAALASGDAQAQPTPKERQAFQQGFNTAMRMAIMETLRACSTGKYELQIIWEGNEYAVPCNVIDKGPVGRDEEKKDGPATNL